MRFISRYKRDILSDKSALLQGDITIIYVYIFKDKILKHREQILTELKGERNNSTIIVAVSTIKIKAGKTKKV